MNTKEQTTISRASFCWLCYCLMCCTTAFGILCASYADKQCKKYYREQEKKGLVEYYDELNQTWLWKEKNK